MPALEAYLTHWPPQLAPTNQAAPYPVLWLTEQGRGISASHTNRQITRHTAAAFGLPVSPYGFRAPVAMTMAVTAPAQIKLVTSLLGHPPTAQAT